MKWMEDKDEMDVHALQNRGKTPWYHSNTCTVGEENVYVAHHLMGRPT